MRAIAMKIALCIGVSVTLMPHADAKLTRVQLEKAAQASGVLPENSSIACQYGEADEVSMTTYAGIKTDDKDLKIDAVMLAKSLTDADPDISKVRVTFYNTQRTSFRSVTVRSSDVKAFGAGLVDKDSLLNGLDVVKGSNAPVQQAGTKPAKEEPYTKSGREDAVPRAIVRPASNGWMVCTIDNITFMFPAAWSEDENKRGDQYSDSKRLMKFVPGARGAYVELRWYPGARTLEKTFAKKRHDHMDDRNKTPVTIKATIQIGPQKAQAFQEAYYSLHNDRGKSKVAFERHVYFSAGDNIYKFKLSSPKAQAGSLNTVFSSLLDTVRL